MADQEHYFTADPKSAPKPRQVELKLPSNKKVQLATAAGTFSPEQVDLGTSILIKRAPLPQPGQTILDLGCGYGPITAALALEVPGLKLVAVDTNERSLALTRKNAQSLGIEGAVVSLPDAVDKAMQFDAIYSNPPIRIGKKALHELLTRWMSQLKSGGCAYLVVHKYLGSDSLQSWLIESGWPTERLCSVKGFRILKATQP
jgi:16S rRNA (guanine1207-N2)-methyltransferase